MGNTILQSLPRITDGLITRESFESVNFLSDQGWTILNGVPDTTNTASFDGLQSFIMDSSYPQIQKEVTTGFAYGVGYFLDDSTQTTSTFKPFIIWQTSGGQVFGLGVDNSVSTGFYTKIINGVASATTIARASGWRKFWITASAPNVITLSVDTTTAATSTWTTALTKTKVGAYVYTGTPAFGYFDLIEINVSYLVTVYGLSPGQAVTLYDSTGTSIGTGTATSESVAISASGQVSPFDAYIAITRTDGIRPYFRTPVQAFSAGDDYMFNVFDLGRRVPSFGLDREANRDDKEATSGRNESLFYFSRDKVQLTLSDLTEDQHHLLSRWWSTASQGQVFAVAIDSADTYIGKLSAIPVIGAGTAVVTSAVGLNRGSRIFIKQADDVAFEAAKVASISSTTLTLERDLLNSYAVGDAVRNVYYWPYCITLDKMPALKLTSAKLKRWSMTINFKEALF